jgi:hypothetical protein
MFIAGKLFGIHIYNKEGGGGIECQFNSITGM